MGKQSKSRIIAFGDIHGQADMLDRLLSRISPMPDDQLVFLGDYIDRGPDSRGVVERLLELQSEFPHTIFLRGNHDQLLLDALVEVGLRDAPRLRDLSPTFMAGVSATDSAMFFSNGGRETLRSYGVDNLTDGILQSHVDFLAATKFLWRHENFVFVHAGIAPDLADDEQNADSGAIRPPIPLQTGPPVPEQTGPGIPL